MGAYPLNQFPVTQEVLHDWVFDHRCGALAEDLRRDGLVAAYREFVL
jgi:hypothetical protein